MISSGSKKRRQVLQIRPRMWQEEQNAATNLRDLSIHSHAADMLGRM